MQLQSTSYFIWLLLIIWPLTAVRAAQACCRKCYRCCYVVACFAFPNSFGSKSLCGDRYILIKYICSNTATTVIIWRQSKKLKTWAWFQFKWDYKCACSYSRFHPKLSNAVRETLVEDFSGRNRRAPLGNIKKRWQFKFEVRFAALRVDRVSKSNFFQNAFFLARYAFFKESSGDDCFLWNGCYLPMLQDSETDSFKTSPAKLLDRKSSMRYS